jgi:hypothetical protein
LPDAAVGVRDAPLSPCRRRRFSVRFLDLLTKNGQAATHPKTAETTENYTSPGSASRNRIGCPVDAVTNSPCHITALPRTTVPTGQPVTVTPS